MENKLLYRVPEVAEALAVSRAKVYQLIQSGALRLGRSGTRTSCVRSFESPSHTACSPSSGGRRTPVPVEANCCSCSAT